MCGGGDSAGDKRLRNIHIYYILETVPGGLTTFHHRFINSVPSVASILQDQKYLWSDIVVNTTQLFVITLIFFPHRPKLSYNLVSVFLSTIVEPFWKENYLTGGP